MIADEPTGNLDTRSSLEIMEIFQRLNEEHALTILLVTHETDIARHARRLVEIRDGRVRHDAPVARPLVALESLEALPAEKEATDALLDDPQDRLARPGAQ
jgi:putative ABC transport system ATP-binding protein